MDPQKYSDLQPIILHAFNLLPNVIFWAILEMVTWELLKKIGWELFIIIIMKLPKRAYRNKLFLYDGV